MAAKRIPALDGVRSAAILLVVFGHAVFASRPASDPHAVPWLQPLANRAHLGVDIFFALSGFLIGRQLFGELRATGTLRWGRFVLRRGLRIWPLYYTVCVASLALTYAVAHRWPPAGGVAADLLFVTNLTGETIVRGGWSLATEEQFYLIAPTALWLAWKTRAPAVKVALALGVLALAISPIRTWIYTRDLAAGMSPYAARWFDIHERPWTHCDGLVLGLALALLEVYAPATFARGPRALLGVGGAALAAALVASLWLFPIGSQYLIAALLAVLVMWWCAAAPSSGLARALGWRGFATIARLSYGMYLWYRFPLEHIAPWVAGLSPDRHGLRATGFAIETLVLVLLAGFTLAGLSYRLVEQPMLRLRDRVLPGA